MAIQIKNKAIPALPRSKNYPVGTTIFNSGGGSQSSSSSGPVSDTGLTKEIRVNAPQTGHISPGAIFKQGTGYEQIFRKMLYKPVPATLVGKLSTANDVEYGSAKGVLTYTATRNDNGAMIKSYYDDNEENVLEFSSEVNAAQTAIRRLTGNYTKGETYTATAVFAASDDLDEITLNSKISVNVLRKWFAGVCSSIPQTSDDVRSLVSCGLYGGSGTFKFPVGQWKIVVICVPANTIKEITIASSYGNFIENEKVCKGPISISVEGANRSEAIDYKMWVIQTQGLNDPDSFTFKTI
ncbi:hypothetical protein [Bacteroides faecis]|jgi:hypothetical protein|uniref:hypothetical protein n=1 Tax=Bacteroides faecis TaxID=674529 RepID=UPI001D068D72|nr:hypothetical protein [Bacteroides faecis]MCB6635313.1 hypothetical protein [Bacteroides faecis]MCE8941585.1 hypothetical protein [Bacteroides faecis]